MKKASTGRKAALATKIVCASVGVLPASLLVLAQIDICTIASPRCLDHSHFFRDVALANPNFKTIPISNIGMLGSHDCFADGIGMFTGEDPNQADRIALYKYADFLGRGAMVRLSRAQDVNVYDQLNAGVRYIDARICHVNGEYYNSHTLLADKFENNLKLILKWLDENPGEFVVIYVYGFYYDEKVETKTEAWENLRKFIEKVTYNGHNLFYYDNAPDKKIDALTYNDITDNGNKAGAMFFYYTGDPVDVSEQSNWYFKHLNFNNNYEDVHLPTNSMLRVNASAGTMKSNAFKQHIINRVAEASRKNNLSKYIRYLQIQTTPNENDIMETVTSWSLIEKARYHNRYVLDLFTEDEWVNNILPYMPIILCDNVTCNINGFNTDVINLLKKYNSKI